ncbi:MAG: DUF11 domain-containing protein, partial [Phycisphaerales bacterium]|nr:DUF11 domain-containing protein [Phycisphaerales bacterium]
MKFRYAMGRLARACAAAALGFALAALPLPAAHACSIEGSFIQPQPDALFGASFDGTNIRVLLPDSNGNLAPVEIAPPPGMPSSAYSNVRLSPSRDFLFAWAADGLNTDIYIYDVPPMGLGSFSPVIEGVEIPGMIAHRGWYDRPDISPRRTCYVASTRTAASTEMQKILWVDLDAHVASFDPFDFNSPIGAVTFSPSGTCALVQHDTNDISVTDYNVISLCDGTFGSNIAPGALLNLDEAAFGRVVRVRTMGGSPVFDVEVYHQPSQGPEVIDRVFTLDDCACTGTPVTGACCFTDGSCIPALTQAECMTMGGSAWTAGVDCAVANCNPADPTGTCCFLDGSCMVLTNSDCVAMGGTSWVMNGTCTPNFCPPPAPLMNITLAGPVTVYAGQLYSYQLTYGNTGAAVGTNVQVRMTIPNGSVFQAASAGGMRSGSQVIWNLPNIAPGESNTVTMDVLAFCTSTSITASIYSVSTSPGTTTNGTIPVVTTVNPESQEPVDVQLETYSLPNDPVHPGDVIGYRMTVTNTSGSERGTIRTTLYDLGGSFGNIIDDGGGTVQTVGNQIQWSAAFGPFETRVFEFEFNVEDCLEFYVDEVGIDQFDMRIACGPSVGFHPGLRFPAFREIESSYAIVPAPGQTGPGGNLPQIYPGQTFAPIRRGAIFEVQVTIDNNTDEVRTVAFDGDFPPGLLPVGDPPFTMPTDAGAWFDGPGNSFGWDGDIPAMGQVRVTALVQLDPATSECRISPRITGGEPDCQTIDNSLTFMVVPEVPADPYLVGLSTARGLWMVQKGQVNQESLFCLPAEINTTLALAPGGDIYVSGLAAYRFNPVNLDFEVYDFGEFGGGGKQRGEGGGSGGGNVPGTFDTVAYSSVDDMVYWLGNGDNGATIWEMPAGTADPTILYEDSNYFSFEGGIVDREGRILVPNGN